MDTASDEQLSHREAAIESIRESTKQTLAELAEKGYTLDCSYATKLEGQTDREGEELEGDAYWLDINTESEREANRIRSGKLFLPKEPNGVLISIYHGMPGEDCVAKEQNYVNELLRNGYTVWFGRHSGIARNEDNRKLYFGADQVTQDYEVLGRDQTGGALSPEFLKDFADEPLTDMRTFSGKFETAMMAGHSLGSTSIVNTIRKLEQAGDTETLEKLKKVVLMNGLLGDGTFPEDRAQPIGGMRLTQETFGTAYEALAKKYFRVPDDVGERLVGSLRDILKENHRVGKDSRLPGSIDYVISSSPTDAYLTWEAAQKTAGDTRNGLLIADLTESSVKPEKTNVSDIFGPEFAPIGPDTIASANQAAKAEYGGSQHNAPNFRPETLVRLFEADIRGRHTVAFSAERGDSGE